MVPLGLVAVLALPAAAAISDVFWWNRIIGSIQRRLGERRRLGRRSRSSSARSKANTAHDVAGAPNYRGRRVDHVIVGNSRQEGDARAPKQRSGTGSSVPVVHVHVF